MNNLKKIGVVSVAVLVTFVSGCSNKITTDTPSSAVSKEINTVLVKRGSIVPTFSGQSHVEQSVPFVISLTERGSFKPALRVGDKVKKGSVVGWSNGKEILAPVDASVVRIMKTGVDLPANFPVLELNYIGFSLKVDAGHFVESIGNAALSGKFQVKDGAGPTDCKAIVYVVADSQGSYSSDSEKLDTANANNASYSSQDSGSEDATEKDLKSNSEHELPRVSSTSLSCLIDSSVLVRPGQQATVVLTALQRNNVLLAPVSAIAGRQEKGKVLQVKDSVTREVEVKLGVSDGANIEILSGVNEGDAISVVAPNLDSRKS